MYAFEIKVLKVIQVYCENDASCNVNGPSTTWNQFENTKTTG